MGFFQKLSAGLKKTKDGLMRALDDLFTSSELDDDFYEELEELLVMGDVGVTTAGRISEELRRRTREKGIKQTGPARDELRALLAEWLTADEPIHLRTKPSVILVIGVNGVGKTTTIGKIAGSLHSQGKAVLLAAADTFRAAAIEQLEIWAGRAGVPIIKSQEGADPAAVVFDAASAAKARGADVLICDTAGRLHNKKHLMDELTKITRVLRRELPEADLETLLVLDATTGQNGLNQAEAFMESAQITGIVLTKLDGTAKGGVAIAIKDRLGVPIRYIGVGEQIDDLQPFVPEEFVAALFAGEDSTWN